MEPHTKLELARMQCGKTQEEVAAYLGISRNTLIAYEKGKSAIPLTVFTRLSKLYHCDVFDIFSVHTDHLIYDAPIMELYNAHAQYQIEQKQTINKINGIYLPDEYYREEYEHILSQFI